MSSIVFVIVPVSVPVPLLTWICLRETVYLQIVFYGKAARLMVGFMIGVAFMLFQLFFMLAVIYIGLGQEAGENHHGIILFHIIIIFKIEFYIYCY